MNDHTDGRYCRRLSRRAKIAQSGVEAQARCGTQNDERGSAVRSASGVCRPRHDYRSSAMSSWSVRGVLGDARSGLFLTGRLAKAALRHPWGRESVLWRSWLFPLEVGVFALLPLIGAWLGFWTWRTAVPTSIGLSIVTALMLARLGRRGEQNYPGV